MIKKLGRKDLELSTYLNLMNHESYGSVLSTHRRKVRDEGSCSGSFRHLPLPFSELPIVMGTWSWFKRVYVPQYCRDGRGRVVIFLPMFSDCVRPFLVRECAYILFSLL